MSRQSDSTDQPATHALPAKPPQTQHTGFSFKPRNVATARPAAQTAPGVSASPYPPNTGGYGGYQGYDQSYTQDNSQWASQGQAGQYGGGGDYGAYDAELEHQAQMHQWQANYGNAGKTPGNANNLPLEHNRLNGSTASGPADPRKTVVRQGGGQKWEDPTLLEWGDAHRMFVGNLAGEVTDESLLKAFSKYASVQKAKVIRDKRSTKSKGYGFVSFLDADDFFQAAKDMQGKYIGSHPVLIKRAETDIKVTNKKTEQRGHNNKNKSAGAAANGSGSKKDAVLGPKPGQGVQKKAPQSKYKMLG